ncbi:restriction endonuclease [Geotalea uraniireducens]|uniref:Restriction endonuclease n=1 Tax=Geotalea uraniireducens (strain Rf4) TaxID=351605 RepID=A5G7I7_GEOUR|nr:restriction endonuclease [Geotalea uraniireducens]ABQ27755.1 restriction endonuclease [Geotalea uraniireducens Rf4]
MLPLMQIAAKANGNELQLSAAIDQLADDFKLTEEERKELLPSGGTFKFSSRASWARTYLQKAGLLEATRRGFFKITQRGVDVLKKKPSRIDNKLLSQFAEFLEFQGKKKSKKENDSTPHDTPIESIASHYEQIRHALASEILDKVKKCSPQFFERLVILLLVKMGYGGSLKDAGQAVGKTGDGGIDGVIREDKLGLDNIYIQAKRWTDKPVGSPDIDQFAGALSKKKASKGIFITTSNFTKDALASVKEYSSRIILIDGSQLAEYMIDHGVGVSVESIYEIKKVDSDFFEYDL